VPEALREARVDALPRRTISASSVIASRKTAQRGQLRDG
jgi:hypothetical protein